MKLCTDAATSHRMAGIRRQNTGPELLVRHALASLGIRYRVANGDLPGSPDIANRTRRWAIFVHGCYWHRHDGCARASTPKRNVDFWLAKFDDNVARDARVQRALLARGYRVLTIWGCEAERTATLVTRLRRFLAIDRKASFETN